MNERFNAKKDRFKGLGLEFLRILNLTYWTKHLLSPKTTSILDIALRLQTSVANGGCDKRHLLWHVHERPINDNDLQQIPHSIHQHIHKCYAKV